MEQLLFSLYSKEGRCNLNLQSARKVSIERYGLDQVPEGKRQTKWYEYVVMQGSFMVNAGNFLIPAFAVMHGGLSLFMAILATTIGASLAYLCVAALSIPGAKYGIPAQYALRFILGVRGTQLISSPTRVVSSLYWFSVQTIGGALVLKEVLYTYFHLQIPLLLLTISLGSMMVIFALVGFDAIKKVLTQLMPLLLLGQAVMLFLFVRGIMYTGMEWNFFISSEQVSMQTFFLYSSLTFVQYIAALHSSSDLTRYSKNYKHGFYGLFIGSLVGFLVTTTLGTISGKFYNHMNPFVASIQLTDSKIVIMIILVSAMCSMISVNINNAYSGAFSLLNSIPRLGRVKATIIVGAIALMLSAFPTIVNEAEVYISMLGVLLVPLAAIIVTDYIVVKRGLLRIEDAGRILTTYRYNKLGLILVVIGAVLYYAIPEQYSPGFVTFSLIGLSYGLIQTYNKKDSSV